MSRGARRPARAARGKRGIDAVALALYDGLFAACAEEMGATLMRTAHSPNIKERLDHSCAVFDAAGRLVAQAAHIRPRSRPRSRSLRSGRATRCSSTIRSRAARTSPTSRS